MKFLCISNLKKKNHSFYKNKKQQLFPTFIIIRNVSWSANQHIAMISERSCDTEDWSNDAENSKKTFFFWDQINSVLVNQKYFFKKIKFSPTPNFEQLCIIYQIYCASLDYLTWESTSHLRWRSVHVIMLSVLQWRVDSWLLSLGM